jgi:hypothetical protein
LKGRQCHAEWECCDIELTCLYSRKSGNTPVNHCKKPSILERGVKSVISRIGKK